MHGMCPPSCCPSWGCLWAPGAAHLSVMPHQRSAAHGSPVVAGCHDQCSISPCLCHAARQLDGGPRGCRGGSEVRDTSWEQGPFVPQAHTHIRSLSLPAAGGPWAKHGVHDSPAPGAHGVPAGGTPRWSPAPPALKCKHGEGIPVVSSFFLQPVSSHRTSWAVRDILCCGIHSVGAIMSTGAKGRCTSLQLCMDAQRPGAPLLWRQAAQRTYGFPIPGGVQGQAGWGPGWQQHLPRKGMLA